MSRQMCKLGIAWIVLSSGGACHSNLKLGEAADSAGATGRSQRAYGESANSSSGGTAALAGATGGTATLAGATGGTATPAGATGGTAALAGATGGTATPAGARGTVTDIVASVDHSCALVDGGVYCWGSNEHGQLGNASVGNSQTAVSVTGLPDGATALALGDRFTCVVVNGKAWCWGMNDFGQLGDSTAATSSSVPVPVQSLSAEVTAVAAGGRHACAVVDGGVRCWGSNEFGQLGNASTVDRRDSVPVGSLTTGVTSIAAGDSFSCAIAEGRIYCWGNNDYGQLGDASTVSSATPVGVLGLSSPATAIALGSRHACAVWDKEVHCWGVIGPSGVGGVAPGFSNSIPVLVGELTAGVVWIVYEDGVTMLVMPGVTAITSGFEHSCSIVNGGVKCWRPLVSEFPQETLFTSGVSVISAGSHHDCALINGVAKCWGANGYGQLGNNSTVDSNEPVQVLFP